MVYGLLFIFVGRSEGKRPLGRSRRRWEDIIRIYVREIGWKVVPLHSSRSGQEPVAGICEHGGEFLD
jgi:hypothetical protein